MERYRNLSGDSGVDAYEIGDDFVKVRFKPGVVYWYTEERDRPAGMSPC